MIAQLSQIEEERGSGRITLPAYTWVEQGFSCITFDFIGHVSYTSSSRQVQQLYRLGYQVKRIGTAILGQIEYLEAQNGWVIRAIGRHTLPAGESLTYPTWEAARDYLWEQYQDTKRKAVAALAEA